MEDGYIKTVEETLNYFGTDAERGLSLDQIKTNQEKYGPNELPTEEGKTIWQLVLEQFDDLLVKILLLAAIISFIISDYIRQPIDVKPSQYRIDGNELQITWPDNHQSSYDILKLSASTFENYKKIAQKYGQKQLWNAKSIKSLPYARISFPDYLCDDNVAKTFVSSLVQYGVAFIENVPPNMLTTELAIKRLFNLHKTFFGEMWTFNDDKVHNDNAQTREFLAAHTDNMYFDDAAGIQALHCLTHTGQGGETLLVDGFNVLNDLKAQNESLFQRLCSTNVESEYIENGRHHTYTAPIVKLNSLTQQPEQIRFNSYDRAPMRSIPMSEMTTFYRDMQTFVRSIQSPDNEWWFKLEPGTIVFFDNWRILHGRSSYIGYRKMGGGYVSRTEFMSVARTMDLVS